MSEIKMDVYYYNSEFTILPKWSFFEFRQQNNQDKTTIAK